MGVCVGFGMLLLQCFLCSSSCPPPVTLLHVSGTSAAILDLLPDTAEDATAVPQGEPQTDSGCLNCHHCTYLWELRES